MGEVAGVSIEAGRDAVEVRASAYRWSWTAIDDRFVVRDCDGQVVAAATLQPVVTVAVTPVGTECLRAGSPCVERRDSTVAFDYAGESGSVLRVRLRFADHGFWFEPLTLEDPQRRPVVSVHLFARVDDAGQAVATLECSYLVQPGLSASPGLSPVIDSVARLSMTTWLGRGSTQDPRVQHAQWALPVHYVAGLSMAGLPTQRDAIAGGLSKAFCVGLTDIPAADVVMVASIGRYSPVLEYREDLWGRRSGTGAATVGATWFWTFGTDYRDAILGYYRALRTAGTVALPDSSPAKRAVMAASQFNTWGAQAAMGRQWDSFDGAALDDIVQRLERAGMKARCLVIDDKWEGQYGLLEHSQERFPHFEAQLDQFRADGYRVGLWAAFLRCEDPAALGLEPSHMLKDPSGQPLRIIGRDGSYYLFDLSQSETAQALRERARAFARRYRPDLIKFDFGYELPSLSVAAPQDRAWGGERMLQLGLEVVVGAMREVLPDLVVMYYSLSPLLGKFIDLHSIDDLWLAGEEYHLEANRRIYFSSLLGELGMPSYGSGGYDWTDMQQTWFDSVVCGAVGSLGSFVGDPVGSSPSPADVARFNGLDRLVRATPRFSVQALCGPRVGFSTGARSSSWAREEDGRLVCVALRPRHFDGGEGVRAHGPVTTDVQVVVSVLDGDDLASAERLGLVPYGSGTVRIQHEGPVVAVGVTVHHLGGAVSQSTATLTASAVVVPVEDGLATAEPVEWVEVCLDR